MPMTACQIMVSHALRHDLAMIIIRHALRHACIISFALRNTLRHALRHALGLAKAFSLKFHFPTGPGRSHVAKTQPLCSESFAFTKNVVITSLPEVIRWCRRSQILVSQNSLKIRCFFDFSWRPLKNLFFGPKKPFGGNL